jgi:hypothetical protein
MGILGIKGFVKISLIEIQSAAQEKMLPSASSLHRLVLVASTIKMRDEAVISETSATGKITMSTRWSSNDCCAT